MRLLFWLFQSMWAGGKGSLIGAIALLAVGLFAFYFMCLPYFNAPLKMNADDFIDLTMPSPLQLVEFSGEMVDGERGATLDGERGYYGIIEMDNQLYRLLLVASLEPLDEDQTEFVGTLSGRDPIHIEVFNNIVHDKDLEGRAIEAIFMIGKPSMDTVWSYFVLDGLLLGLGLIGLLRCAFVYFRAKV